MPTPLNPPSLSIHYHLEIYHTSFVNDPSMSFSSSNPFMAFNVGDFFDASGWSHDSKPGQWWKITAIVHRVWEIKDFHVGQQVGICVEDVAQPD